MGKACDCCDGKGFHVVREEKEEHCDKCNGSGVIPCEGRSASKEQFWRGNKKQSIDIPKIF